MLIGAYFLVDSPFRFRRVFHIWWSTLFWCLLVGLVLIAKSVTGWGAVKVGLFPVSDSPLWFCSAYCLILLASPLFNLAINAMDRKTHLGFLWVWGTLILIVPTLRANCGVFRPEIWVCAYAYFFAGYMKRYRPRVLDDMRVILALCAIPVLRIALMWAVKDQPYAGSVHAYCEFWRAMLNAVPNFATAVGIFCLFRRLSFQSGIINGMAKSVLGVYVIHQVPCFYPYLWNGVFKAHYHAGHSHQISYTLMMIGTVFVVGTILDWGKRRALIGLVERNRWVLALESRIDAIFNALAPKAKTAGAGRGESG